MVGAGLAGLSAAMALVEQGWQVTVYEGARWAGGRCRSYRDPQLDTVIDNGNHLVLSGNAAVRRHLKRIGATAALTGPRDAAFPFVDLRSDLRWTLRPNAGRIPWWILSPRRRVPGTKPRDYLTLAALRQAARDQVIGDIVATRGKLWERLIAPLMVSALNTPAERASARLAGAIVGETLAKGGRACRPLVATPNLSAAFIDPALRWLEARGATIRFGARLKRVETRQARAEALYFSAERMALSPEDRVILAVQPWIAADLLPGLVVPTEHEAIVNAHFACAPPAGTPPITGVVGGTAEWAFAFPDRISTTTSAAGELCDMNREALARLLWKDVARVLQIEGEMPRWQIVRERRATFSATPAQDRLRPGAATPLANLLLAGDWTQTGLPATIEGALRSGETAARLSGSAWKSGKVRGR